MIQAVKCPSCGAGVSTPVNDASAERQCEYCGTVFRVPSEVERGRARDEDLKYISAKHCPRCHHSTVETEVNKARVRACHHCGGVWVPHKALKRVGKLSGKAQKSLGSLNRSRVRRDSRQAVCRRAAIRCPKCSELMTQKVYTKGATVTVDVCTRHGTWFDENELMVAHRDIAKRLGLKSGKSRKWHKKFKFKDAWDHGPMASMLDVLEDIVEDILD